LIPWPHCSTTIHFLARMAKREKELGL
jgi:hypothetical protein